MKTLKDIKGNLDVVERLNRTLSRELEISGLITQSSLLSVEMVGTFFFSESMC
jgi:hypothetical protein